MNQAMQDAQAVQSGQMTMDQLPEDRRANLDAAMSLAKNTPVDATQAKLDAYKAIKTDVNDLSASIDQSNKSCFMSVCASNFSLAKGWGAAAATVQATDTAADTIRATKMGGPVALALANEWKAARDIGENAFAGGAAGAKAFGQGGLVEAGPGNAGSGGEGHGGGGEGGASHPPGAGGEGGAETGERVANGLQSTAKLADAGLHTYRQPEEQERFARGDTEEAAQTRADRGVSALKGLADGAEAYNNFSKGDTYGGSASSTKAVGDIVSAGGNRKLGEQITSTGEAMENFKKAQEAGLTTEGVSQGLQGLGNAGKIFNKDAGLAVQDTGKLVGTIGQIQDIRETEAQVLQVREHLTDTIDQRINNLQQFQQLQLMMQTGGTPVYTLP